MPTKRERFVNLTGKMQTNIDDAAQQLIDIDAAIAASTTAITDIQTDITALDAIGNRNAAQNVELRSLRKDLALWRALRDSQRLNKKLIRNDVTTSRFGLLLHGGSSTVRDSDLNGSE